MRGAWRQDVGSRRWLQPSAARVSCESRAGCSGLAASAQASLANKPADSCAEEYDMNAEVAAWQHCQIKLLLVQDRQGH